MDVTRHNFGEEYDNIVAAINESTFLAVDGEFTGLDTPEHGRPAPFDTPAERYQKHRNGSSNFLLIQFGLCAFKLDEEKRTYEAKPYNFYIFPRPYHRHSPDRRFLCQSSSMDFLMSHGFDFNKLFREGISYLTPEQEFRMKADLELKHEEENKAAPALFSPDGSHIKKVQVIVPEEQKQFLNDICDKISQYVDSEDQEPLSLPPFNAYQRKLVYQTVEEKFPLIHLETKTGEKKERYMVVSRTKNAQDRLKKELEKQAMEKMELDIQVGFAKVIRAITESGKLTVGHNMFLDVLFSISQFHCSLPETLEDFKAVVKSVFPRLLDTKLMANTHPFKDHIINTSLDEVRMTVQQPPFSPVQIDLPKDFERYGDGTCSLHEAGYDAFITGSCFATMTKFLGSFQNPPSDFLSPTSHVIEPFVNKLFLMRMADIPYLNLNGPDLEVSRDHVFHVTFPKEWKASDLYSLFHAFGNVQISWLTESTAYVALYKKENAKTALIALTQNPISSVHVVSYAFHHRSKNLRWTAQSPGINSASPVSSANSKRKMATPDADFPPSKVKRRSLSNEPPAYPSIPEEDESGETELSNTSNMQTDGGDSKSKKENGKEEKMFEESETWL